MRGEPLLEGYGGEAASWSVSSVPGPPVSPVPGEGTGVTSVSGGRMSPALTARPAVAFPAASCTSRLGPAVFEALR